MNVKAWNSSAASHCGAVRKINEDAFLSRADEGLWVVADGMGGHEAGEVASEMITASMGEMDLDRPLADVVDELEDALLKVHKNIQNYSRSHCDGRTMGSTVVVLYLRGNAGVCLWAGDSRLYRLRNRCLSQLSEDHSQVNEMLVRGMITPEEAINHPASNVITRAVGASDTLYLDINLINLQDGDRLLLCSDGLYGALSEDRISAMLAEDDVPRIADLLVGQAVQAGARDNVTAVAVKV